MKKNECFEVGNIVNMHCGEQGIIVEILDDTWVLLIQCDGHIDKSHINDIWQTDTVAQSGKEALHELFMKTLGYSSIYEEDNPGKSRPLSPVDFLPLSDDEGEIPF